MAKRGKGKGKGPKSKNANPATYKMVVDNRLKELIKLRTYLSKTLLKDDPVVMNHLDDWIRYLRGLKTKAGNPPMMFKAMLAAARPPWPIT